MEQMGGDVPRQQETVARVEFARWREPVSAPKTVGYFVRQVDSARYQQRFQIQNVYILTVQIKAGVD